LKSLDEITLRLLNAVAGIFLVLLPLLLMRNWSRFSITSMVLLVSISPAFVFYSRYYIHEMILVLFSYSAIFCTYCYLRDKKIVWLLVSAVSFGMMIATKETWVLIMSAMVASLLITAVLSVSNRNSILAKIKEIPRSHWFLFISTAALVIFLLFTSFLQRIADFSHILTAYKTYFIRSSENIIHVHPWFMYFKWLLFFPTDGGSYWSEGLIALLALIGIYYILIKKNPNTPVKTFVVFITVFSLILTAIYSIIPYKTPWNLLTFWYGLILVAGFGINRIIDSVSKKKIRLVISTLFILAAGHLAWQSYMINYEKYDSPDNPYCYAQPANDVIKFKDKLDQIARINEQGYDIPIQVIAEKNDYWPLPWYLREFERTGWWDHVELSGSSAAVILAAAGMEEQLIQKFYDIPPPGKRILYLPLFEEYMELRPGVEWRGYITKKIWDQLNSPDLPELPQTN
ncbi:MAG: flippase activity-associated protein Agl23, partial [Anaerolineales bacterium]